MSRSANLLDSRIYGCAYSVVVKSFQNRVPLHQNDVHLCSILRETKHKALQEFAQLLRSLTPATVDRYRFGNATKEEGELLFHGVSKAEVTSARMQQTK